MIKSGFFVVMSIFSFSAFAQYNKDMGIDPDFLYEPTPVVSSPPQTHTMPPTTSGSGNAFSALEIGAETVALAEAGTTAVAAGAGSAALASTFAVGAIAAPVIGSHATAGLLLVALTDDENNGTTSTNSNSASAAK